MTFGKLDAPFVRGREIRNDRLGQTRQANLCPLHQGDLGRTGHRGHRDEWNRDPRSFQ